MNNLASDVVYAHWGGMVRAMLLNSILWITVLLIPVLPIAGRLLCRGMSTFSLMQDPSSSQKSGGDYL